MYMYQMSAICIRMDIESVTLVYHVVRLPLVSLSFQTVK